MDMIDLEQLRKDMEAGTQGDWIVDETGDTHYIARLPQLEREYIALRKAADALAEALEWAEDVAVTQSALVEFYATSIKALTAYRKATK